MTKKFDKQRRLWQGTSPAMTTNEKEEECLPRRRSLPWSRAVQAGGATPAPPVGTALGPHGVNIMDFCKAYNAQTESMRGNVIPVEITIYEDRSFTSSPRPRRPPS